MTTKKTSGKGQTQKVARIVIVDDHPIVRRGLGQLIGQETDLQFVGEAESEVEALRVIEKTQPDMAIVDISLKESNGLDLIKAIRVRWPHMLVVVLSVHDDTFYAERALRAGARGYMVKDEASGDVIAALRRVVRGEVYLNERMSDRMLSKLAEPNARGTASSVTDLSDRELEVFLLIGRGMATRTIAETLGLSAKTIESHRERIKKKLNVSSGSELLRDAIRWVQFQQGS